MIICTAILAATLTRAELIERMRTPPATRVDGLVQVAANCDAEMRREFMMPISRFVSKTCDDLYSVTSIKKERFEEPGIYVFICNGRTNDTSVLSRSFVRGNKTHYTRIYLLAPEYSDLEKFRVEIACAFMLALKGKTITEAEAKRILLDTDPQKRIDYKYAEIRRWLKGEKTELDDDAMLKLCRTILQPGVARVDDIDRFASYLSLYPSYYAFPFAGKYHVCSFKQAIELKDADPFVRFAAYLKAPAIVAYGGGRGESLDQASKLYAKFLYELASAKKTNDELLAMLEEADIKLNVAYEEARKFEEGNIK